MNLNEYNKIKNLSKDFWNSNPCGGTWTSVKEQNEWRYAKEPWILDIIKNLELSNKIVLEVGCGPGLDTLQLSKESKRVIGLDLTENSLKSASEKIKKENYSNINLILGDAEKLPIRKNSIDVVYSYGVLHHTPNTEAAVKEIYNVLKDKGYGVVMLYRKYTIQAAIISFIRAFKCIYGKYESFPRKENNPIKGTSIEELLHCPVLKKYSKREAKKIFLIFRKVRIEYYQTGFSRLIDFMPRRRGFFFNKTKKFLWWLEKITRQYFGFYMVIYFKKN